jgi:osmotically-inducible protein OsmY
MKKLLILLWPCLISACSTIATGGAEITGLSLLHDRRTGEALMKDEQIEIKAALELNASDDIRDRAHFNVTAYNGIVLITGEAPDAVLRDKMLEKVRVIPNVKMVHNEVVIAPPSSYSSRSADTLITTKVKSALSNIRDLPGFDATRVKVVTENGVVYLLGLLHQTEAKAAGEQVRSVKGVKKVVKVFEVIE